MARQQNDWAILFCGERSENSLSYSANFFLGVATLTKPETLKIK